MSRRVLKDREPDGDYTAVLSGQISKADLKLRSNSRARAVYQEERQKGYQDGLEKGRADGRQEAFDGAQTEMGRMVEAFAAELHQATEWLSAAAEQYWLRSETALRELAIALAQKLLKSELVQNPDAIASVVRDAALRVANSRDVRVRVNVSDLPSLRARHSELQAALDGAANLEIVASGDVSPGGCIVESLTGVVDATVETQIGQLSEAMEKAA